MGRRARLSTKRNKTVDGEREKGRGRGSERIAEKGTKNDLADAS